MPATYEPIASTTLGADAASVTFSSIPGTYTDLVLVARYGIESAKLTEVYVRFNSDSGTNYSLTNLYGTGSTAASNRSSNSSLGVFLSATGDNAVNIGIMDIMSYANTNVFKTTLSRDAGPGRGAARIVSLWRSTAAITSMEISRFAATNNLVAGSTFSLYGIKAA